MKTFRMIGMALFAVLMCVNFTSCSSDDDDETQEEFSIVGTWKMIQGDEMDEWTVILREDGTGRDSWTYNEYSDEYEITYRFDAKNLILYTQVPGEDQLEWKVIIKNTKEITLQTSFIDDDGKEHTQNYVFRKQ